MVYTEDTLVQQTTAGCLEQRLLYYEAPPRVFTLACSLFGPVNK
jgi:hypothetical protein